MFGFGRDWTLQRSPLAPSVPLEGTDTVQGLRTIERLAVARLLTQSDGGGGETSDSRNTNRDVSSTQNRRRRYQRYKGPFIEQLTLDDLKKDPKPWLTNFSSIQNFSQHSYTVPANLDILCERMDENVVYYATNYIRVAFCILMLTFYLRPGALIGAIMLGVTMAYNLKRALEVQQQQQQQQVRNQQLNSQSTLGAALAAVTWMAIAYTKCIPILTLGLFISFIFCLLHTSLRTSPSEEAIIIRNARRRPHLHVVGNQSSQPRTHFTLQQALLVWPKKRNTHGTTTNNRSSSGNGSGTGSSRNDGDDPRLVFKQIGRALLAIIAYWCRLGWQWSIYYSLMLWDALRRPFTPALRSYTPHHAPFRNINNTPWN